MSISKFHHSNFRFHFFALRYYAVVLAADGPPVVAAAPVLPLIVTLLTFCWSCDVETGFAAVLLLLLAEGCYYGYGCG